MTFLNSTASRRSSRWVGAGVTAFLVTGVVTAQAAAIPAAKPRTVAAPAPAAIPGKGASTAPAGLGYLPPKPLVIAAVQVSAANNFLEMISGGTKAKDDASDALAGMLQLMKDQIDGPLAVGLYADAEGKPSTVIMAAHLQQSGLTRELLGGIAAMGGDEKNGPKKTAYQGQTLITMDLPKGGPNPLQVAMQPTFTVTDTDYLVLGTTLDAVKQSLDTGLKASGGGLAARSDVVTALKNYPPTSATDVWLMLPKLPGNLSVGKTTMPNWMSGLPLGATVMGLRFTPLGVRFDGLAAIERVKTAAHPVTP